MSEAIEPTEDQLQIYSADVITAFAVPSVVAFHVPNGGKRPIAVAKLLKRFGTLAGVPDWLFILPGARAAFMEIKTRKGGLRKTQKTFRDRVITNGCEYRLVRTVNEIDAALIELGVIKTKPGVLAAQPPVLAYRSGHVRFGRMIRRNRAANGVKNGNISAKPEKSKNSASAANTDLWSAENGQNNTCGGVAGYGLFTD